MIDMIVQQVVPTCVEAGVGDVDALRQGVRDVSTALDAIEAAAELQQKARLARKLRLECMVDVRRHCDDAEAQCPADTWPMPTYADLLFLDQTTE